MKKLVTMVLKQPPARTSARGTVRWTLAEMKQLGRTPDSVLARRSGRTIHEVVAMRESRSNSLARCPIRQWRREQDILSARLQRNAGSWASRQCAFDCSSWFDSRP
jgi:hypothetical protein